MGKPLLLLCFLFMITLTLTSCSEKYCCKYYISDICASQEDNLAYLAFDLEKGEVLSGKISVYETFAEVIFYYSEPDLLQTFEAALDPVRIGMMEEYTFKLQAKEATRVMCYFRYTNWPTVLGDFLCNIPPAKTWVQSKDVPYGSWEEPKMYEAPSHIDWALIGFGILVGLGTIYILSQQLPSRSSRRRKKDEGTTARR